MIITDLATRHRTSVLMLTLPAGALGSYLAARTYDTTGSYLLALQTFAVLNVVTLLSLFAVRRETRDAVS